jgi:hypothetical protein
MADYTAASAAALTALNSSADGGMVEEYEIQSGSSRRRVKRGKAVDQIASSVMLEGLAARRASGGLFRVAKLRDATS